MKSILETLGSDSIFDNYLGPNSFNGRDEADAVLRNGQQAVDSVSLLSLTPVPVTVTLRIQNNNKGAEVRFRTGSLNLL